MANKSSVTKITEDGIVSNRRCKFVAVTLTPGSDDAELILYDNASAASGTEIFRMEADYSEDQTTRTFLLIPGMGCANGIYADISGTDAYAHVYFIP